MAKYQIAVDNATFGKFGAVVDEEDLGGCNVPALVAGGVLVPDVEVKPTNMADSATNKKE
jgi:hypothetical protein